MFINLLYSYLLLIVSFYHWKKSDVHLYLDVEQQEVELYLTDYSLTQIPK